MSVRIMALDVGDRRIGVAISDTLGITAQRLPVLERRNLDEDLQALAGLVERHEVERLVVGLPLTLRGAHGPQARKVEGLIRLLRRRISVPVDWVDERLTTRQGQRSLLAMDVSRRKRRLVIDAVAAQLILQQYLDAQRHTP